MAATTALIVGTASALVGSGMSFRQAAKQNKLAKEAQRSQAQAETEARKRLSQNTMMGLSIQKEPYELQREALLSTGAKAIEAGRESDRGVAETAGRVVEQQAQEQGRVRSAMGQELTDIDRLVRGEQSRLADMGMGLEMMKLEGAQKAEADSMKASRDAMVQGFQGIASAAGQAMAGAPLYFKTQGARSYEDAMKFAKAQGIEDVQSIASSVAGLEGAQGMTPLQFQDYISQDPERGKLLLNALSNIDNKKNAEFTNSMLNNNFFDIYGPIGY